MTQIRNIQFKACFNYFCDLSNSHRCTHQSLQDTHVFLKLKYATHMHAFILLQILTHMTPKTHATDHSTSFYLKTQSRHQNPRPHSRHHFSDANQYLNDPHLTNPTKTLLISFFYSDCNRFLDHFTLHNSRTNTPFYSHNIEIKTWNNELKRLQYLTLIKSVYKLL